MDKPKTRVDRQQVQALANDYRTMGEQSKDAHGVELADMLQALLAEVDELTTVNEALTSACEHDAHKRVVAEHRADTLKQALVDVAAYRDNNLEHLAALRKARRAVMSDDQNFMNPSVSTFARVADTQPLLKMIESGKIPIELLSFAAEHAGRIAMSVATALLPLLKHPKFFVREGAVYGLEALIDAEVLHHLRLVAKTDPDEVVRGAAREALCEWTLPVDLSREEMLLIDRGLSVLRAGRGNLSEVAGVLQDKLYRAVLHDRDLKSFRLVGL